jgi:RNA polymerase sigma-70 factor, ECF subfamily
MTLTCPIQDHQKMAGNSGQPVQPTTDLELMLALQNRQVSALAKIYDRYAKVVYGLAYTILQDWQEAEETTQDVFLTLWQQNRYNPTRSSLKSFLTLLTRNRAIDRLRSRRSRSQVLQRWQTMLSTQPPSSLDALESTERSQQIRSALSQLSPDQRQVLEIVYYGGCSQSEIAHGLNLPLSTVKTRSRQALCKLRQALQLSDLGNNSAPL